jgi:tRNA1(Val) A37 N6-methylase TrmN6
VFGNSLATIQLKLVETLPKTEHLLILGEGNGGILKSIYNHSPYLHIDYLEASIKMIQLAQTNIPKGQRISFIHSDQLPAPSPIQCRLCGLLFLFILGEQHYRKDRSSK